MKKVTMIRVARYQPGKAGCYIGRSQSSPLGNPYTVKEYGRVKAIELYREWLHSRLEERDPAVRWALNSLYKEAVKGSVTLLCHCAPLPCHGEVVAEVLGEALAARGHEVVVEVEGRLSARPEGLPSTRVAVFGPRDMGPQAGAFKARLKRALEEEGEVVVTSGGAEGADTVGLEVAQEMGLWAEVFPPTKEYRVFYPGIYTWGEVKAPPYPEEVRNLARRAYGPGWEGLDWFVQALMVRNAALLLGAAKAYYFPPRSRGGGTRHALRVAEILGVELVCLG